MQLTCRRNRRHFDAEGEKLLAKAEHASKDKLETLIEKLRKPQKTIGQH